MPRHAQTFLRIRRLPSALILILLTTSACTSLNYPDPESTPAKPVSSADSPATAQSTGVDGTKTSTSTTPEPAVIPPAAENDESDEVARSWSELARSARRARQAGRFEEAAELLEQAAMQLSMRAPDNAQRQSIHGARARIALDLIRSGRTEEGEALAETLLAEAETEPAITGSATVDLAIAVADLRAQEAARDGLEISSLPLMRIALQASAKEKASKARLQLAYDISRLAEREDDPSLARWGIDLALEDARLLEPTKMGQLAALELARTRIAITQDDLVAAQESADEANRLLEEFGANAGNLALSESTLAHVAALKGDLDGARALAASAEDRLAGEARISPSTRRIILAELARAARATGETETARRRYEAALEIPGAQTPSDLDLEDRLASELAALAEAGASTGIEVPSEASEQSAEP
jgi:hypothetical protein